MPYQLLLQEIYQKLQKLVKEHEQLKREYARLKKETAQKDRDIEDKAKALAVLQDQVAVLRTSGGKSAGADKKELEKKISQYIRDIDKAIALLNE